MMASFRGAGSVGFLLNVCSFGTWNPPISITAPNIRVWTLCRATVLFRSHTFPLLTCLDRRRSCADCTDAGTHQSAMREAALVRDPRYKFDTTRRRSIYSHNILLLGSKSTSRREKINSSSNSSSIARRYEQAQVCDDLSAGCHEPKRSTSGPL